MFKQNFTKITNFIYVEIESLLWLYFLPLYHWLELCGMILQGYGQYLGTIEFNFWHWYFVTEFSHL